MPQSITVQHKNISITFTEEDHSYIDMYNNRYTSVTTLIGRGFEKFNAEEIAKKKAIRENCDWHDLVNEWTEKGERAANEGTRLHENCENQILNKYEKMHKPKSINEKINFDLAFNAVNKIKENHNNIKFEPEKLVFSPKLRLAGSIDLLVHCIDKKYIIYDWKNIKEISLFGFNNKCGIIDATKNVQDSNYWHYALQLQIYEIILKVENYIPKNAHVSRILNVFEHGKFNQYELPNMMENAKNLIKFNLQNPENV